ncbi:MAG: hypothetical protein JWR38_524 [Mucilaginibacter sp.]|nr:hypothetical protein [Mucilaginibacter sp.]
MKLILYRDELRDTNFKVNAVDPGYTATDFNNDQRQAPLPKLVGAS